MINIIIVDDHMFIRDGIKLHLENDDRYQVIAEAGNGLEALELLRKQHIHLVILDVNMPEMNGIDCTREIKKLYPLTKILGLTHLKENQYIRKMIEAGASGYLLKNCSEQELKMAIESIIKNGVYYSPEVTESVMDSFRSNLNKAGSPDNPIPLTKRELEVLQLILKEYSNKEIAEKLHISPRTVDAHKQNLIGKTGSKNIAGLVLFAIRHKLFKDT